MLTHSHFKSSQKLDQGLHGPYLRCLYLQQFQKFLETKSRPPWTPVQMLTYSNFKSSQKLDQGLHGTYLRCLQLQQFQKLQKLQQGLHLLDLQQFQKIFETQARLLPTISYMLVLTAILEVFRNSSRASMDPSVDACTNTPRSASLIEPNTSFNATDSSSCQEKKQPIIDLQTCIPEFQN